MLHRKPPPSLKLHPTHSTLRALEVLNRQAHRQSQE